VYILDPTSLSRVKVHIFSLSKRSQKFQHKNKKPKLGTDKKREKGKSNVVQKRENVTMLAKIMEKYLENGFCTKSENPA
jgi:hypothetical protein